MTWVKGIDVSFSAVTREWCQRRLGEGYRVFVQCAWTGGYANHAGIKAVARANLAAALDAGMAPAVYVNANPWFGAEESLGRAIEAVGQDLFDRLTVVAVDWEISTTTVSQVDALCSLVESRGKKAPVYTARWFAGENTDPRLKARRAWLADYDGDPRIETTVLCGPWGIPDLIGKQYKGTTDIEGVKADLNTFDLEYFSASPAPEEEDMGLSQDDFTRITEIVKANTAEGLVRETGKGAVWSVSNGMRRHIPNPAILNAEGFDWSEIKELSATDMALIPIFDDLVRGIVDAALANVKLNVTAAQIVQLANAIAKATVDLEAERLKA